MDERTWATLENIHENWITYHLQSFAIVNNPTFLKLNFTIQPSDHHEAEENAQDQTQGLWSFSHHTSVTRFRGPHGPLELDRL